MNATAAVFPSLAERLAALPWAGLEADLDAHGCAVIPALLPPADCAAIASWYDDDSRFRSRVVMGAHGFGRGEYKYLAYPLPPLVAELRAALYPPLAAIANRWNAALGEPAGFPADHGA